MSFQDTAFIFFIALLLFGPKKLPELARYVGKLMGEFRRASNEFRMQMEDELRISEQAEQQKKIAAMEAAAPVPPIEPPSESPAESSLESLNALDAAPEPTHETIPEHHIDARPPEPTPEPLPIASAGAIDMMPPATGLPVGRSPGSSSLASLFDAIPQTPAPGSTPATETETTHHG